MKTSVLEHKDFARVCRDLAWSEIASMPAMRAKLGVRARPLADLDWSSKGWALDSLACVQLATAAATWCNAFDTGFEDIFLAKRNAVDWAAAMRRVADSGGTHVTFSSAGSTGQRKHIRHQLALLMGEATAWANLLCRGREEREAKGKTSLEPDLEPNLEPDLEADFVVGRVVVLAPTHHIYGFIWGVLLPLALKVPVVDAELATLPELLPGDLLVAVPDQWAWLAKANHLTQLWPANVVGISSTSPLPSAVHQALTIAQRGQGIAPKSAVAQLLEIYGSSETGGLAWRDTAMQPYSLLEGRVRTSSDGVALQLESGALAELAVQDELVWVDQSKFHVLARLDHCVQVGGHNVSPTWVAEQLASHPCVEHATTRLSAHARPPRLKAFIVLKAPADPSGRAELENWATENLPWYANPCAFSYGLTLPRTSMGKLCDWPD